jgi:hypothetical protein
MTLTGCFVPEAKPQAIVDLLNGEIERAANDPAVRPRLEAKSNVLTLSPGGVRREAEEGDPRTGRRRRKDEHQAE